MIGHIELNCALSSSIEEELISRFGDEVFRDGLPF